MTETYLVIEHEQRLLCITERDAEMLVRLEDPAGWWGKTEPSSFSGKVYFCLVVLAITWCGGRLWLS